jgi:hypothetical protein
VFCLRSTGKILTLAPSLLLLLSVPAPATEFKGFDRTAQVRASDVIVSGTIARTAARWSDDRSAIVTEAELTIDEVWKGFPESDRITVRTLGGTVDEVRLEVDGAAALAAGERVVLFLHRERDDAYSPWGMRFGKYEVVELAGKPFALGSTPRSSRAAVDGRRTAVPLESLRAEVIALVRNGR